MNNVLLPLTLITFSPFDQYPSARTITENRMSSLLRQNGGLRQIRAKIAMRYWVMTSTWGDHVPVNYSDIFVRINMGCLHCFCLEDINVDGNDGSNYRDVCFVTNPFHDYGCGANCLKINSHISCKINL